jgi:hypothetical protein
LRGPVVLVRGFILALMLAACGDEKVGDGSDPAALQCRAALEARINGAFATIDAAPDPTAANAAIATSLAGPKPGECTDVSDDLGAKLLNQLADAAAARYRSGSSSAPGSLPTPGSIPPTNRPGPSPSQTPSASVVEEPGPAPVDTSTATPISPTEAPD